MHLIIWPERRLVSDEQIAVWYGDAVANGDVEAPFAMTIPDMIHALNDAGLITTQEG